MNPYANAASRLAGWIPAILTLAVWTQPAVGQPALLRVEAADTVDVRAVRGAPGEPGGVLSRRIEPPKSAIIALFPDSLEPEARKPASERLMAMFASLAGKPWDVEVVSFAGGQVRCWEKLANPIPAGSKIAADLLQRCFLAEDIAGSGEASALRLYSALSRLPGEIAQHREGQAGEWPTVLLAAAALPLDPALREPVEDIVQIAFRARKLKTLLWLPGGGANAPLAPLTRWTGGRALEEPLDLIAEFEDANTAFLEVSWKAPEPKRSYRYYDAELIRSTGSTYCTIRSRSDAPGALLPTVEAVPRFLENIALTEAFLKMPADASEAAQKTADRYESALEFSTNDPHVVDLGVQLYRRLKRSADLARMLEFRLELRAGFEDWKELGLVRSSMEGQEEAAWKALERANSLGRKDFEVLTALATLARRTRKPEAALPLLEAAATEARDARTWFLHADLARDARRQEVRLGSLQQGLEAAPDDLARRAEAIGLLLESRRIADAKSHLEKSRQALSAQPTPALLEEYARFWEASGDKGEALRLYEEVLVRVAGSEPASYHSARLLLELGRDDEALARSARGLAANASSLRLYMLRKDLFVRQFRYGEALSTLWTAAGRIQDSSLLASLASLEDLYGERAAEAFEALAKLLKANKASATEIQATLRRGKLVAMRAGDTVRARWFAAEAGEESPAPPQPATLAVAGGLDVFLKLAGLTAAPPARETLPEWLRAFVARLDASTKDAAEQSREDLSEKMRDLALLANYDSQPGGPLEIALSAAREKPTRDVLRLLGWDWKRGGELTARRSPLTGVLPDLIGPEARQIAARLKAGETHRLTLPVAEIPLLMPAQEWMRGMDSSAPPATILQELVRDDRAARVYVALSVIDQPAREALLRGIGLKKLVEEHSRAFSECAAALEVSRGQVLVPGGTVATRPWTTLAGAAPDNPAEFFRALLVKQDGDLARYYTTIAGLDATHQKLIFRNPTRFTELFALYSEAISPKSARQFMHSPRLYFGLILNALPVDLEGNLQPPGGAPVWAAQPEELESWLKSRSSAPVKPRDGDLLITLMADYFRERRLEGSLLEAFFAVARLNEARTKPLDQRSAATLRLLCLTHQHALPILTRLPFLEAEEFEAFRQMADHLEKFDLEPRNLASGLVQGTLEVLANASALPAQPSSGSAARLTPEAQRELLRNFCRQVAAAREPGHALPAVLALLRRVANPGPAAPGLGTALKKLAVQSPATLVARWEDQRFTVDWNATRAAQLERFWRSQQLADLDNLLQCIEGLAALMEPGGRATASLAALQEPLAKLTAGLQPLPAAIKKAHLSFFGADPQDLTRALGRLTEAARNSKAQSKVPEAVQKVFEELAPEVTASLTGLAYGRVFHPDDAAVRTGPYLVRTHIFAGKQGQDRKPVFASSEDSSTTSGFSRLTGTLQGLEFRAASLLDPPEGLKSPLGRSLFFAQAATFRAFVIPPGDEDFVRIVTLQAKASRELLAASAAQPELRQAVEEASSGLLSLERRRSLFNAIDLGQWDVAWRQLTFGDSVRLFRNYFTTNKRALFESPVLDELKRLESSAADRSLVLWQPSWTGLGEFAPVGRLMPFPYESMQTTRLPGAFGLRCAELQLALWRIGMQHGLTPLATQMIAEPLLRKVYLELSAQPALDWQAALRYYENLPVALVEQSVKEHLRVQAE